MKKIVLIAAVMATALFAEQEMPQDMPQGMPQQMPGDMQQGGKRTPPPEAISACSGKSEDDACSVTTPRGDTMEGTCRNTPDGEYFACIPKGHRPPQER